jgi:hypothetical protein
MARRLSLQFPRYNALMPKKPHPGRRGDPVSLHPLTLDQAMGALVRVKLSDVKKLEAKERAGKKKRKRT